jgi:predicted acetyltransferase
MVVSPHTPYSPDLAPCEFFLFPKMKLKLKGRRFDNIEEIQAESQRVFDTLTEKQIQEAFQKWRRRWDRCLHREGTTSRVMAVDMPNGEFYDFYSVSPEYFGYTLV